MHTNIVKQTYGKVTPDMRPVFVVWAHKPPKKIFKMYCNYALDQFQKSLIVIVDDITPRFWPKSLEKKVVDAIASQHKRFFEENGCETRLLSREWSLYEYFTVAKQTKVNTFLHYLPSKKRSQELYMTELFHFLNNIYAYFIGAKYGDVFLLGENVTGRFFAAREIIQKELMKKSPAVVFKFLK